MDWDISLLLAVNGTRATWMDYLMVLSSDKYFWIWLYVPLLFVMFRRYQWKAVVPLVLVIIAFTVTDQLSVHAFKNVFERLRPCHDPGINAQLQLFEGDCRGMYGFISSHAANTACLAAFLMIGGIIRFKNASFIEKVIFVLLPMYVLLNAYSRVYLGVHYPSDVMAGIIFGALMGWGFSILHKILINRYADQTNLTD